MLCRVYFIYFLRQMAQRVNFVLRPKTFLGLTVKEGTGGWQDPLSLPLKNLPVLRKSPT